MNKSLVYLTIRKLLSNYTYEKLQDINIYKLFNNLPEDCYNKIKEYINEDKFIYFNFNKKLRIFNDEIKAFNFNPRIIYDKIKIIQKNNIGYYIYSCEKGIIILNNNYELIANRDINMFIKKDFIYVVDTNDNSINQFYIKNFKKLFYYPIK